MLFKSFSDYKLQWISGEKIDEQFAKILRKKTIIPRCATTAEALTLINIRPSNILEQMGTLRRKKKLKMSRKNWFKLMEELPASVFL